MENRLKILFFIGSLSSGGKERRLIELLTFLDKTGKYELTIVTKNASVDFPKFFELNVEWIKLKSNRTNLKTVVEFLDIAKRIGPKIIHTWGEIQTFIVLPYILLNGKVRLVNSQITAAPPKIKLSRKLVSKINFYFSDEILSNSFAGLEVYQPPKSKSRVIYNGLNLERFSNLKNPDIVRKEYAVEKKFLVVMVASFSKNKDYLRFFKVGIALTKLRNDTCFIGVGFFDPSESDSYDECVQLTSDYPNLMPIPGTSSVEQLVNAADIGVLFSNASVHGEGISNSIIEYMALGKPVIANDAGGTKELIKSGENGYLLADESPEVIAALIDDLLDNPAKMAEMGQKSRQRILKDFSLQQMGEDFEKVYQSVLISK